MDPATRMFVQGLELGYREVLRVRSTRLFKSGLRRLETVTDVD